ncbi:MAG: Sporulation domain-containing protein [Gallionellaceae bacterium]|nr:MAG: Sporulation domain-containing protein [Gallionellaceae bacterium]
MKLLYGLFGLLLANAAWAAPDMLVDGVKMPAWVERGAQRFPLSPGMELSSGDTLLTGQGARVLLNAADGSAIKLGENARLQVSALAQKRDGASLFSAALEVAKGAFRFTTSVLHRLHARDITVRVAGATAGIRGTDVWGKVGARMSISALEKALGKNLDVADKETKMDFDTVCLIEGKISITHGGETPFVMDQPQTFYVMPKGAAPLPVGGLSSEQLDKWAAETEITAGQGAARSGGKWKVRLLTADSERDALAAYDALRGAGYDARIHPLQDGQYQLRITQLPSRADAEALARELTGKMGIVAPTVGR